MPTTRLQGQPPNTRNEVRIEQMNLSGTSMINCSFVTPNAANGDEVLELIRSGAVKEVPCGGGMQSFYAPVGTILYTVYPENSTRVWKITVGPEGAQAWAEMRSLSQPAATIPAQVATPGAAAAGPSGAGRGLAADAATAVRDGS